jgi:hypothetical protein
MKRTVVLKILILLFGAAPALLAAAEWSAPLTVSSGVDIVNSPAVATGGRGRIATTWQAQQAGVLTIRASVRAPQSALYDATLTRAGETGSRPDIAVSGRGTTVAIWSSYTATYSGIAAARLEPNGTWTTPVEIAPQGTSFADPKVAFDDAGRATAVWALSDCSIGSAVMAADGTWDAPVPVASSCAEELHFVVDAGGRAALSWRTTAVREPVLWIATRDSSGVWSAPFTLAAAARNQYGPQAGISASGDVTAVWRRDSTIYSAYKPDGSAWQSPVVVFDDPNTANTPVIAIARDGNTVVAWTVYQPANGGYQVQAALGGAGAWGAAEPVSPATHIAQYLSAAATMQGTFALAWSEGRSGTIQASDRTPYTPWTAPARTGRGSQSDLAAGDNAGALAWTRGGWGEAIVQISRAQLP